MSESHRISSPYEYKFELGDHVSVFYTPTRELPFWFWHHGIFTGYENGVAYFINLSRNGIMKNTIEDFGGGNEKWRIIEHDYKTFSREDVVKRAVFMLENASQKDRTYNIVNNNCEHFVNFIIEGKKHSEQVTHTVSATAVGLATVGAFSISLINHIRGKTRI